MTPLRRQMIQDMTVRGFSRATHDSYLHAVTELARFHHASPDRLTPREVQRFLVHLVEDRGLAWATCNVYVHALRFFYRVTLGRDAATFRIPRGREARRLPEILSRREVSALIRAAASRRDRALLVTTYGAGLRASEVIHLRLGDVDSGRMCLRIEQGKRRKDRLALLSARLLGELRDYWRACRPEGWLFPGERAERPISPAPPQLPRGQGQGRHHQGGRPAQPQARLRHPHARGRHRPPHHPAPARARQHQDDPRLLPPQRAAPDDHDLAARPVGRAGRLSPAVRPCARRRRRQGSRWRRCSGATARPTASATTRAPTRPAPCGPSRPAAPRPWAATSRPATAAAPSPCATTPAGTATAPSARPWSRSAGSRRAATSSWRPGTTTSCSRCRTPSTR